MSADANLRHPFRAATTEAVGGEGEERFVETAGLYIHRDTTHGGRWAGIQAHNQVKQEQQLTIEMHFLRLLIKNEERSPRKAASLGLESPAGD